LNCSRAAYNGKRGKKKKMRRSSAAELNLRIEGGKERIGIHNFFFFPSEKRSDLFISEVIVAKRGPKTREKQKRV
jgi:hypothetical protein